MMKPRSGGHYTSGLLKFNQSIDQCGGGSQDKPMQQEARRRKAGLTGKSLLVVSRSD